MIGFIVGFVRRFIISLALTLLVLMFAPGLPPHNVNFGDDPLKPNAPFEGGVAVNDKLNKAELVTDQVQGSTLGYIMGPEAFAFKDGYLYTGVYGGDIVRLDLNSEGSPAKGVWQTVARMSHAGVDCGGLHDEAKCGRPLGMDFDKWGFLLVADPYHGLVRVDVTTGKTQVVLAPDHLVDGQPHLLMNAVATSKKSLDGNTVYISSSSSNFNFTQGVYEFLSAGSGRLLKHDMASETTQVLINNISFANGLVLSPDEDYILVCEMAKSRILKYVLTGSEAGTTQVFADNLPGIPDNIRSNGKGGYLVGIPFVNLPEDEVMLVKRLRAFAPLARAAVRLSKISELMFEFLDSILPNDQFKMVAHHLGHLKYTAEVLSKQKYGLVVELNDKGEVTKSWQSPDGSIKSISEAYLHPGDGYIYLGSPYNDYIARVKYD